MDMEIRPDSKIKNLYSLTNFLVFLFYCPIPVIVLQIIKQRPHHLYDFWSLVIAVVGILIFVFFQVYLLAYIKTLRYELTSEDLRLEEGVFWKRRKVIPFHKITNLNTLQGPLERRFDLGHMNVQTAGHGANTSPEGKLVGLQDFDRIKEEVMQKVKLVKSEATTMEDRPREGSEREIQRQMLEVLRRIDKNLQKS
jgi:membrane protein YdbS with pleckstrin-like domain